MHANNQKKQQGFIILMGMLALVLGAAVWFGTVNNIQSNSIKISLQDENLRELQRIKDRMLAYAVLQPEIFRTDSGSTVPRAQEDIPGPGYFPCPDTDGDGNSNAPCGGVGSTVVIGLVPESVSSRHFTFIDEPLEANQYWYAVDSRFLTQNSEYYYDLSYKRFVPLNRASPAIASLTLDDDPLTTDDDARTTDIVMVLFYAGPPVGNQNQSVIAPGNFLELENSDGDADFITTSANPLTFNDYVIPITRTEWNAAVLSRVSIDLITGVTAGTTPDRVPDLCDSVAVTDLHWFNDCKHIGTVPPFTCTFNTVNTDENLYGQGWRTDLSCPP